MTREELLNCPEYWTTLIQNELYRRIHSYMEEHHMNKAQLAEHLGCSRGYVTQLLNGEFDHKLSKLAELSLAIGMAPVISFEDIKHIDEPKTFEGVCRIEIVHTYNAIHAPVSKPASVYTQTLDEFSHMMTNGQCS